MFSARYSSGSLGVGAGFREQLLPVLLEGIGDVLEEDEPQATCFYSAASIEPLRALAAAHSCASKPRVAEVDFCFAVRIRRCCTSRSAPILVPFFRSSARRIAEAIMARLPVAVKRVHHGLPDRGAPDADRSAWERGAGSNAAPLGSVAGGGFEPPTFGL
jgi:hypothetical protein